ncbi:MAG: cupin domain-containing protein [Lysobacteraceae bacterium]|nr:MAG: cupin domain-containing protein [Xanthomonadaceae bacterium]
MHPRALELIRTLELEPHPEGGHYRRVYEATKQVEVNGMLRPLLTSIHFLLTAGAGSRWHRVDATEVWDWQEGSAVELLMYDADARTLSRAQLDTSARGGQLLQVVPAGIWQSARTHGDFSLVNCSVSPGFVWSGLELLDEDSATGRDLRAAGGLGNGTAGAAG